MNSPPPKTFTPRAIVGISHERKMRRPFVIRYPDREMYVDRAGNCWTLPDEFLGHIGKIMPEVKNVLKSMR